MSDQKIPVKNIIFDLGNVLFTLDYPRWREQMATLLQPNELQDLYPTIYKFDTGKISTSLFINGVLSFCNPDKQALDVIRAWNSMLVGMPEDSFRILDELKQTYRLFLYSNNNEMHYGWCMRHFEREHGIPDFNTRYFEGAYYSQEIGFLKPDTAGYRYILNQHQLTGFETLFLDDKPENVEGAIEAGLQSVLIDPEISLRRQLMEMGLQLQAF